MGRGNNHKRAIVLADDEAQRTDIVQLLKSLGYGATECSSLETFDQLSPPLLHGVGVVIVDMTEEETLSRLFALIGQKELSVPVVIVARNVTPIIKARAKQRTESKDLIYGFAPYPLSADQLLGTVWVAVELFQRIQSLTEQIESLQLIERAVAILRARHSTAIHTYQEAHDLFHQIAASHRRTLDQQAKEILKSDENMNLRVSQRPPRSRK